MAILKEAGMEDYWRQFVAEALQQARQSFTGHMNEYRR